MDEQQFLIEGRTYASSDPLLQEALARVHDTPQRPRCMCVRGGIEMYVARHRQYLIKRLPESGPQHHATCASYEPELGQSGLGALIGESIIEHSPESVELRVDFPLARGPGRTAVRRMTQVPADINAPRHRMSLRAVMHFLFERAGFNRWYPAMEGKRTQGVIHKYLLEAADEVQTKGVRLSERLYVPEPFTRARQPELAERRRRKLAVLHCGDGNDQFNMALVLGEYKASETSSLGRKVWLKHMPDAPLLIETRAWERVERCYGDLFEARQADTHTKLRTVMCALIYAKREHLYQIDTTSCMLVTQQWIPIEGLHEAELIDTLTTQKRSFLKPLRYDAHSAAPFPNVLLLDTGAEPTALHVISGFMDPRERAAKIKAVHAQGERVWVWNTDHPIPPFPEPARLKPTPSNARPPGARSEREIQPGSRSRPST